MPQPFNSIYTHGFVRVAAAVPHVRVADPVFNAARIHRLMEQATEQRAALAVFPELGVSAYSNEDLFQQDALQAASIRAVTDLVERSADWGPMLVVGAPLRVQGRLFNCAFVIHRGAVLGIVPKSYLPNYREFYEKRQFSAARDALSDEIEFLGRPAPFGNDLVFKAQNLPDFALHVEICEDVWTPIPPSTYAAMAGATVLANLSASNITIGKADYRRELCSSQSAKCIAAYVYSAAGQGESTTDLAWDGHAMVYANGSLLAESERFAADEQLVFADVDLERLVQDRSRMTSFVDSATDHKDRLASIRTISFDLGIPEGDVPPLQPVYRFPYVPSDPASLDDRCYEVYNIQVHGLEKRLQATGIQRIIIGVSGGLDSTQALIVAARTMDRLGQPRTNVLAYTMPGFATSTSTRQNAHRLMEALGVTGHEIDIRPSARQMLEDIGHPYADGVADYDVTFENVQAGERTSHLFRLANFHNGLVLGTGDLSELALGWATYGVGDQMSHYNVNASVPKTLIQHLIRWVASTEQFGAEASEVLYAILDTEISPELVPGDGEDEGGAAGGGPAQSTEAIIGPYELQDFNLYYTSRFGFRPSKVAFLSYYAWHDESQGGWPQLVPEEKRNEYSLAEIKGWLDVFLYRFFQISQFKRSAMPNGPKVGSGGSLSPRGDWRAPSDSVADTWLDELARNVPDQLQNGHQESTPFLAPTQSPYACK